MGTIFEARRARWTAAGPILLSFGVTAARPAALPAQGEPNTRPNVVVFVADDLGWRDIGIYGNAVVRTPHLDQLARSGLRIVYAFGTTPQCSPSRISTLTGKYAHATRTEDLHTPLPAGERMVPFYAMQQGYFTGMMGKTHIGQAGERQFQWYSPELSQAFPAFLDSAGTRPFLVWVGFHDPHRPYEDTTRRSPHSPARITIPPHLVDSPETRADIVRYYDEIARMDGEIGRMLAELERRKLRENTLVMFFSDNGAPFPREKGTLYDGGTRTPLIFSWPGVIPPGSVYDRGLISLIDLAPTILELMGAALPRGMQGQSLRALLAQPQSYAGRTHVFSERNWHDCDEHQRAVRSQRFKLIRTDAYTELPLCTAADVGGSPSFHALQARARAGRLTTAQRRLFEVPRARLELYDLTADPWELRNVAAEPRYAPQLKALALMLQEWAEGSDDFPAAFRIRDDNTDRITGLLFTPKIPPLRNTNVPPPDERWGKQQSELGM